MLNKYPVIPNHFILATKTYKDQRHVLEEDDLAATLACLRDWERGDDHVNEGRIKRRRLFAFFNSGEHSGASQPHRHVQFLPVEDMEGDAVGKEWRLPMDDPSSRPDSGMSFSFAGMEVEAEGTVANGKPARRDPLGFPFLHFTAPLSPTLASWDVHTVYRTLYARAVSAVKAYNVRCPDQAVETVDGSSGQAEISYNLAMTTSLMAICPRRGEDAGLEIHQQEDGKVERLGPISINGTILAATLMVKSEMEWEVLSGDHSKIRGILETIGFPVDDDDDEANGGGNGGGGDGDDDNGGLQTHHTGARL